MDKTQYPYVFQRIMQQTNSGENIPLIYKNNVPVHRITIFEDICIRNRNNLSITAVEINGFRLTYLELFYEVEKYIKAFIGIGVKKHDIVTVCLPVGVEFICAYFALSTIGAVCNATNVMFMMNDGVRAYTEKRCSEIMLCDTQYFKMLSSVNAFKNNDLKKIILTNGARYSNAENDMEDIASFSESLPGTQFIGENELLLGANESIIIPIVDYDENRASTFTYTSGTTGKSKCMAHSDLAPLFLIASHDFVKRADELPGDRSLLTIPFQHPTGLFYAMVLQLACGKTLVLEPKYDKSIFYSDIRDLKINHAVQAKPFYAQLIEDKASGRLKEGDFKLFKHPYSGGEGIPAAVCSKINDTLHFAGCKNDVTMGYGRSEEGSSTLIAYNIPGRLNTVGRPLPGIKARLVDAITKEEIPSLSGNKGEIQVCTPVMPLHNCYLGEYNTKGTPDNSFTDNYGNVWSQPGDIATIVKCENGDLSYLVLGRNDDCIIKNNNLIYLFELKELINQIDGIQECEIIKLNPDYITSHIVIGKQYRYDKESVVKRIFQSVPDIDGVKIYDAFGINATSGKCDKDGMAKDRTNYFCYKDGNLEIINLD